MGKPRLHGRDHRPGGADPIPGVTINGIQFDTDPQSGNWLYAETTGTGPTIPGPGSEFGFALVDTGDGIYFQHATGGDEVFLSFKHNIDGGLMLGAAYRIAFNVEGGQFQVNGPGGAANFFTVFADGTVLFDALQQAPVSTLPDVVALLVAYGLAV